MAAGDPEDPTGWPAHAAGPERTVAMPRIPGIWEAGRKDPLRSVAQAGAALRRPSGQDPVENPRNLGHCVPARSRIRRAGRRVGLGLLGLLIVGCALPRGAGQYTCTGGEFETGVGGGTVNHQTSWSQGNHKGKTAPCPIDKTYTTYEDSLLGDGCRGKPLHGSLAGFGCAPRPPDQRDSAIPPRCQRCSAPATPDA